jgi:O-antigen biosynthesis protein
MTDMRRLAPALFTSVATGLSATMGRRLTDRSTSRETPIETAPQPQARPKVRGKFLFVGDTKFWVKGVTYGTFRPQPDGTQFPARTQVDADFAQMAAAGLNTVRVYTPPPRWLLDAALTHGLKVMVGLPWAQHVAFLDQPGMADDIVRQLRADVRICAGHTALLCFAVGNEIPASIVRWTTARRVERFIRRLYDAVKSEDPQALVTYVNFPTTEYLRLPFLDFFCFNVYLESREPLEAYLARLQNIAGEKPLLMAEIGLDSLRNGDDAQATSLTWQVRTAFAAGCIGAMVFAWTDEWHRGGHDINDWDFGITTRERSAKPALTAVSHAFADAPFPASTPWPRVSVVICSHNGARTIRDTLDACMQLAYPDFEIIVVNDGSTDGLSSIVEQYDVRYITTVNRGLSAARNTGWQEATGELIAYIDDDAYPDAHWLHYIAYRFLQGDWVGVGGPNIAPPGDGWIAECVANAPGGPVQVLVSDVEAEHIPGCNMVFRRAALAAIDGFDVRYRAAGDDVDLCWRLQERGGKIGFHAGAMDWHHRRNSVRMYWQQQKGYGKAEALLEEKWPERYNAAGHLRWSGRLYGKGFTEALRVRPSRIYQGTWGTAAYQSVYEPDAGTLMSLPLMPESLSSTTIVLARRTVASRCAITNVVRPCMSTSIACCT